jgi:flagellar protein FlaF
MSRQKKSNQPPPKLSHSIASGTYGAQARQHAGNRDVEAQALLKAARKLQELEKNWDKRTPALLEESVKFNRQLWVLFYDTALNNAKNSGDQSDLHQNIVNMAGFVFKRSIDLMADPQQGKIGILININREVAAGLMAKPISGPISGN